MFKYHILLAVAFISCIIYVYIRFRLYCQLALFQCHLGFIV